MSSVWRPLQQVFSEVFIQGNGRSNVAIDAKENARVGQSVLPSHPLSTISMITSVSVMYGRTYERTYAEVTQPNFIRYHAGARRGSAIIFYNRL